MMASDNWRMDAFRAIGNWDAFTTRISMQKWGEVLPRNLRPTDGDMIIDNGGRILMVEYKAGIASFAELNTGQKLLYKHFTENGKGTQAVMLCRYQQKHPEYICGIDDVISCQLMTYANGRIHTSDVYGGDKVTDIALSWLHDVDYAETE